MSNQKLEKLIEGLQAASLYQRQKISKYHSLLSSLQGNNEHYSIHLLTSHDDRLVHAACDFLAEHFGYGMDDLDRITDEWIFDPSIAYHAVCNQNGNVIAAGNSSILPLESYHHPTNQTILVIWYIAVDPAYRGKKLSHEMYQSMYQFALDQAPVNNSELKAMVGEVSGKNLPTLERLLHKPEIGRKRVFYEDAAGAIREIPYISPPLQWNAETGEPEEEAQQNHLMLRLLNGQEEMPVNDLREMVKAIYKDSYMPRREDFTNSWAYDAACIAVFIYMDNIIFSSDLREAKNGVVFLR